MLRKMARLGCPTAVRAPGAVTPVGHRAPVLREGRTSTNIRVSLGVIRGIPV
jgi:hypothetical protein